MRLGCLAQRRRKASEIGPKGDPSWGWGGGEVLMEMTPIGVIKVIGLGHNDLQTLTDTLLR